MIKRFEEFTAAISCIYRYVQKIEREVMKQYGLRGPHAQCLIGIAQYEEGITASKLCSVCEKDKAAVSRILTELEGKGLINRSYSGAVYRIPIMLTEKGKKATAEMSTLAEKAVEYAGKDLNAAERKAFYAALDSISQNLLKLSSEEGLEALKK